MDNSKFVTSVCCVCASHFLCYPPCLSTHHQKTFISIATLPLTLPPSLHLPGDRSVTELIIVNSILLLAALHVIWDVWGAFCSCHQGLLMVIARCRLPERESRSFNLVADGIPRWPRWVPPSIPDLPPPACWLQHGLRFGVWCQEKVKAGKDAWQMYYITGAAPECCVNGLLWKERVLIDLMVRIYWCGGGAPLRLRKCHHQVTHTVDTSS